MRAIQVCLIPLLMISSNLQAHHGVVGQFDLEQTFSLDGHITDMEYVNPHSWVYLDVTGADGGTESWNCELRGATALRRSGWDRDMFTTGTRIRIEGSPDRREPNTCYVLTIEFPADDLSLERYEQIEVTSEQAPRAARTGWGVPNLAGDWAARQFLPQEGEEVGILKPETENDRLNIESLFREDGLFQSIGNLNGQLTEQGSQLVAEFDWDASAQYRCAPMSLLGDLIFDWYVNRITQTEDRIEIFYGNSGYQRTIHLNTQVFPETLEASPFGYSVGNWDADVLIVRTRGFLPGVLYMVPIPDLAPLLPPGVIVHSADLEVEERFTLEPGESALRRQYRATDPITFEGSYEGSDVMYPSEVEYLGVNCDVETSRLPDGTRVNQ